MTDKLISLPFAYHESGHAVLAHLFGDYVFEIHLNFNFSDNTPAFVAKKYGQEKYYYLAFETNSLTQLIDCKIEEVELAAMKYCMALLGGPIAEQVYKSGRNDILDLPIYDSPDFNLCKNVVSLLTSLNPRKDYSEFIRDCVMTALGFLREEQVWLTVELLSNRILESEKLILLQPEINEVFEIGGLSEFKTRHGK